MVSLGLVLLPAMHAFANSSPPSKIATLDLTFTPTHAPSGIADGLAVSYAFIPARGSEAPLTLELDTLEPGLQRSTDVVTDLVVSDDRGPLALRDRVRRNNDAGSHETWTTVRPPSGAVKVSYRMHVARNMVTKRGPQVDLQAAGGGVSGGYIGFLVLPDIAGGSFDTRVRWNLLPGETAVSSYGEGDYKGTFTVEKLTGTLFLAGPVMTYRTPGQAKDAGLEVYALGVRQEQLKQAGDWTARAYAAEVKAFNLSGNRPYRFMIRSYDGGANASGRAAEHSFLLYVPPGSDPGTNALHFTVAHEMVHSLARYLEKENIDGDWYTEGTANYMAITVPDAAGLYTPSQYLELVQAESAGYYTNAQRSVPNSKLAATVWSGRNAWMLPYNRGTMYFADLDAKLRAHGAKVTVLDLVNEMSKRIDAGEPSDRHTWLDVLSKRAGQWAINDWNDMMSGTVIFPAKGAFGACMQSRKEDVRIFDLGFSLPVRLIAGSTIGGLVQGSPAERAGLRNGDVLVTGTDINPMAGSLDKPVVLNVHRNDKSMTITFDPKSGLQPGLAWASSCLQGGAH
jgi:predicted metalloprotease with PDZ domain